MTRVGLVATFDALAPGSWSGTPSGVARGLEALGVETVAIVARPRRLPRLTAGAWARVRHPNPTVAHRSRVWVRMATRHALGEVERLNLDALVAFGADAYELPLGRPTATFDDATFAATRRSAYSELRRYRESQTARWIERQARNCLAATVCCAASTWARDSLVADYGVPAERVRVVGLGHDARSAVAPERDWTQPRFLFVGRDWERKNGERLLRAFARLHAELPQAELDVVSLAPSRDVPGVRFHGELALGEQPAQQVLAELYARATCLVVPSLFEPFGLVYLEAAAAGIPSIGSRTGGWETAIGDGGLAVDPTSEAELLDAMRRVADPELARTLGGRGLARVQEFNWQAVARRVLDALGV